MAAAAVEAEVARSRGAPAPPPLPDLRSMRAKLEAGGGAYATYGDFLAEGAALGAAWLYEQVGGLDRLLPIDPREGTVPVG